MIRSLAAVLTLAAGWSLTDLSLDRLRWNARERTATGIEALEAENQPSAIAAFETASRLDEQDPLLRFNAGSAPLAAATTEGAILEGAIRHLELAAENGSESLRAAANYNLGNARLSADDTAGAIAAYEQTLRLAPEHQEAKFNLELALQQQQQQQQQDQQQQENESDSSDQQESEGQKPSPDPQEQDQDEQQEQDSEQNQNGEPEEQEEDGRKDQLPQFEDQSDMSAEQAAAILEAVENLEREQRRKQAEQEMKKSSRKGKDW